MLLDRRAQRVGGQLLHRFDPELAPDERRPLDHRPLRGAEPVEPGGEDGLDRRAAPRARPPSRPRRSAPPSARRRAGCPLPRARRARGRRVEARPAGECVDHRLADASRERLEQEGDGVVFAAAPGRSGVEELGPREAEEQDGHVTDEVGELGRGGRAERARPSGCPRSRARAGARRPAPRPGRAPPRPPRRPTPPSPRGRRAPARSSAASASPPRSSAIPAAPAVPRRLVDDLPQREEGDPLAVREAPPDEHSGVARRRLSSSSRGEPRLADAGGSEQREEDESALADSAPERRVELLELVRAADERRLQPAFECRRAVDEVDQPPGLERPLDRGARRARSPRPAPPTGTRRRVASVRRISPAAAAACSRPWAVLRTSPVATTAPSAAIASPVCTATVAPSPRESTAFRSSVAARSARIASSSFACGTPKTPTTDPSPAISAESRRDVRSRRIPPLRHWRMTRSATSGSASARSPVSATPATEDGDHFPRLMGRHRLSRRRRRLDRCRRGRRLRRAHGRRGQRLVLVEDRPVELLQRRARVDPQLLDEPSRGCRSRRRAPPPAGRRGRAPASAGRGGAHGAGAPASAPPARRRARRGGRSARSASTRSSVHASRSSSSRAISDCANGS